MPKIRRIQAYPFRIPLRGALRWGKSSELGALEHLLLEVELSDGSLGRAEFPPRPTIYGETLKGAQAALEYLRPLLLGREVDEPAVLQTLEAFPANWALRGSLEMALSEARARAQGHELSDEITPARDRVRVAYILGIAEGEELWRDAEWAYQRGIRVLKVKVGRNLEKDLQRIQALRQAFPEMELYADANQTLTPEEAIRYLEAWASMGLRYVEEPLPIEEVTARQTLRQAQILPIIADDSALTLRDLRRELLLETFDVLNVKPARSGWTWSRVMQAMAREQGKRIMVGSQALSSFGAWQTALLAFEPGVEEPCELAFHIKAEGGFLEFPPFREGWLYWAELSRARFDPQAFREFCTSQDGLA
jgi:L-alanine-DL-glutamate epimerase-like enolase superfamily enzyme